MKPRSTVFLQTVLVLIAIVTLVVMIRFPLIEGRAENLGLIQIYFDPFILYGYISSIAYFIILYKIFHLLGYIRQNKIFSLIAVNTVRSIKNGAIILCLLIVMAGVIIKLFHAKEDDPAGFLALCIVAGFFSMVFAAAASVFESILWHGTYRRSNIVDPDDEIKK